MANGYSQVCNDRCNINFSIGRYTKQSYIIFGIFYFRSLLFRLGIMVSKGKTTKKGGLKI